MGILKSEPLKREMLVCIGTVYSIVHVEFVVPLKSSFKDPAADLKAEYKTSPFGKKKSMLLPD
jgi:hypothetical protein